MKPLVSIMVCTFDRAQTLPRALGSALGQTYPNVEVIVYDDGSTDGTADLLAQKKYRRVRYHRAKENRGVGYARNALLQLAKGEYACWLDSDDMSNRWRVEFLLRAMRRFPSSFMRSAFTVFSTSAGCEYWDRPPEHRRRRQFSCATAFFRTELGRQISYRTDILLGEDSLWEKRFILQHGPGMALPLTLYHIGRGKGLKRLSKARAWGQSKEFYRSLRKRDRETVKVIDDIRAAGISASRFPPRVPEDICAEWVGQL